MKICDIHLRQKGHLSTIYSSLPLTKKQYLERFINWISTFHACPGDTIIVYGSVARGSERQSSDIDVLLISERNRKAYLRKDEFEARAVSIYFIQLDDLRLDGSEHKYGGYFVTKLLLPYIMYGENVVTDIEESIYNFFAPFVVNSEFKSLQTKSIMDPLNLYSRIQPEYSAVLLMVSKDKGGAKLLSNCRLYLRGILTRHFDTERFLSTDALSLLADIHRKFYSSGVIFHDDVQWIERYSAKARERNTQYASGTNT